MTAFDQFDHDAGQQVYRFSLGEMANRDMYRYVQEQKLDLDGNIPSKYMEIIYDCIIQVAQGMEFAHAHGLVHGDFGLHNVCVVQDGVTPVYKINNFTPGTSLKQPDSRDARYWPFCKGRVNETIEDKIEIMKLKDIYSIGICLLELMIGRTSSQNVSITLDCLPLTWGEYPEASPLIKVLFDCIQLSAISQPDGILQEIR